MFEELQRIFSSAQERSLVFAIFRIDVETQSRRSKQGILWLERQTSKLIKARCFGTAATASKSASLLRVVSGRMVKTPRPARASLKSGAPKAVAEAVSLSHQADPARTGPAAVA